MDIDPHASGFWIDDFQVLSGRGFEKGTIRGHEGYGITHGRLKLESRCEMDGIVRPQWMSSNEAANTPEHIVAKVDANVGLPIAPEIPQCRGVSASGKPPFTVPTGERRIDFRMGDLSRRDRTLDEDHPSDALQPFSATKRFTSALVSR